MIELSNLSQYYRVGGRTVLALENVSLRFAEGSFTAVCGESGSGKSTLLNILGLMDRPTSGSYHLAGQATEQLRDAEKSALRAKTLGFLFQSFRLVATQTVLENVMLPLDIAKIPGGKGAWKQRALELLEQVGLAERANHVPAELSGGQMQRAAFARALAANPRVLLADEPTGNLDAHNRDLILDLISQFHAEGKTVVVVTHDPLVATRASRQIVLQNGRLIEDTAKNISNRQKILTR
jgi:putative ABC transport system ATP-binding protein